MSAELTASTRLERSRERLRQVMRPSSAPPGAADNQGTGGLITVWLEKLNSIPGASVVIAAVRSWWTQHPLRLTSMVAAASLKAVVRPIAKRNPLALVLGAVLLGGLLAWSRPWRWIFRSALFAGLLPRFLTRAVAQLPARSWIQALAALVPQQRRPR